ncbi:MAG TPA: MerR family transcriptional regulator [Gammaproteobacteria bacterium]|nr:MerR family transcriptional regulator [Gammaproteobacteria bacterium]
MTDDVFSGRILEEELELTLGQLSRACAVNAEWLLTLVEEGILEPLTGTPPWRFSGTSLRRVRTVRRLQEDLGVNLAGAALALELLEEIDALHARLAAVRPVGGWR